MLVTVYFSRLSPETNSTLKALDAKGIEYCIVDLSNDPADREMLKSLGYIQPPVVIVGDSHWSGFRPDKIDELADKLEKAKQLFAA